MDVRLRRTARIARDRTLPKGTRRVARIYAKRKYGSRFLGVASEWRLAWSAYNSLSGRPTYEHHANEVERHVWLFADLSNVIGGPLSLKQTARLVSECRASWLSLSFQDRALLETAVMRQLTDEGILLHERFRLTWMREEGLVIGAAAAAMYVADPPSEDLAFSLNMYDPPRDVCIHGRDPCYLRCGIRRGLDGRWAPILRAEREAWFSSSSAMQQHA